MTGALTGTTELSTVLVSLAAQCLNVPVSELFRDVPLTRYGLDSLATVELTAAIEASFGCRLHESILIEYPDLESLERYLTTSAEGCRPSRTLEELMRSDAALPADIRPSGATNVPATCGTLLLTGATGFLGGFLLRSLLLNTRRSICCLVRVAAGESGFQRLRASQERYLIWDPAFESRIEVVEGDLALPDLGLGPERYAALCNGVDAIYHSAATVNWVYSYAALRDVNVFGTVELLRCACTSRLKPFHFISSAAVCYSTCGPREVRENCDMLPYLSGLHLGYAQSKCVAETLVRQASERGVPVSIHRPALISGARVSGISNRDDLLSKLIKGVIMLGAAPDLDWSVDCCPVDSVAEAIVHLTSGRIPPEMSHLVSPFPRHWRELVLWMNFFGYQVSLMPYREWLERVRVEAAANSHPLRGLLPFFAREPVGEGGLTLPELFEDPVRSRVICDRTRIYLHNGQVGIPNISAHLLDRYFRRFIADGFLPPTTVSEHQNAGRGDTPLDSGIVTGLMRCYCNDMALEVSAVRSDWNRGVPSIIAELSSWKHGSVAGLDRYRLDLVRSGGEPEAIAVVAKRKARDEQLITTAAQIAGFCSQSLGSAFARFGHDIGLVGSQLREIGIYRQSDARFRRHTPIFYGAHVNDSQDEWLLLLEDISGLELLDSADATDDWSRECIEAAITGLADLHSIWYKRSAELRAEAWLGPVIPASRREEMSDLWLALADFAAPRFSRSFGSSVRTLQSRLIADVGPRWRQLERLPQTLVHNDFNPRNLALRRENGSVRLCAYDWELATVGVPQHDLAEFLCFVLKPGVERGEVNYYMHLHRTALERASHCTIDPDYWETGFRLTLHDLLIDRFAMYAMIDRYRPQKFLTRVVSTWSSLFELFPLQTTGELT